MSLTLKEAIQARKLKLIATELEPLARKDRTVKKIVDTLKKGKEPNPDDINSLKGDTQDDVVMAFASVIGPTQTSKFLGEAKTIKVGEDAVGAKQPHYVIVKDRKVIAKGNKEKMMEKCGDGERVWLSTKDVGDIVEQKTKEDPDIGDRKGSQPAVYHKGLSKSTKEKRDAQFKKQAKMDDDNPAAYKPAPGDKEAKTKESKYTKKYKEMFGESTTKTALQKKSEDSGIAYGILKDVYDRGVAAWRTGHRPGTTPAQWGMARVNSFITGGKTRTTADKDLWQKHKGKKEEFEMSDNELVEMKVGDTVRIKDKPKNVVDKKMFGKSGVVMGKMGRDFRVKLANGRSLMVDPKDLEMVNENIEDRMPASPDEKSMALKQAEFIQYVGREIGEHLVANKEFPEWMQNKLSALHQKAKDMHATLGAHGETFEEVELDESMTAKIYDAAMFLKRVLGFESKYEERLRQKREGAKKLKKGDIEGFVKDAEPFLNFIKDGKARYYKGLLNKLKMKARSFNKLEGEDKTFAAMDAVDQMIQIRNYISKNKTQMKESVELNEVTSYTDPSYKGWDKKLTNYGLKKGYTPVAVIGKGSKDMVLFDLKPSDKSAVRGIRLSSGEKIYRYASDGTVSGDMMPYVKVNLDKGMVYFLDQDSSSGKTDEVKFDGRGEKQGFVRVVESVELSEAGAKLKDGDSFDHSIVVNDVKVTLARRGKGMSVPYVVYLDGKEWKTFQNRKTALKAGEEHALTKDGTFKVKFTDAKSLNRWMMKNRVYKYISLDKKNHVLELPMSVKSKAQPKNNDEIVSIEEASGQKLFMFDNKKDAQAKAKEIRGKMMELGPKNFAVITKDLTVVREEDELDEMKVRGQEVFDKTFANRTQAENFAKKNGGTVRQVGRVFYVFKEEVDMSNYNYRTEAHSPMHVSKAIRVAEKMGGNMTGAVEKIEKMSKGLSDHPKVKAALRMANEEFDLTEQKKKKDMTPDELEDELFDMSRLMNMAIEDGIWSKSKLINTLATGGFNKAKISKALDMYKKEFDKSPRLMNYEKGVKILKRAKVHEGVELNEKYSVYKPLSKEGRALVIVDVKTFNSSNEMDKFLKQPKNKEWKETGVIGLKDSGKYRMEVFHQRNGEIQRRFKKGGIANLREKAESEAQAIAARIALRHKREGTKPKAGTASAEMMKMSEKDLEDFTKVKKGAPEKVEEARKMSAAGHVWRARMDYPFVVRATVGRVSNELVGSYKTFKDAIKAAEKEKDAVVKHSMSGRLLYSKGKKTKDATRYESVELDEAKMSDAEVLSAAKKLASNGKDEKTKKFGQGLVDFYKKNDSFTPDQVAGLQNIMKNASFQMAKEEVELDEAFRKGDKVKIKDGGDFHGKSGVIRRVGTGSKRGSYTVDVGNQTMSFEDDELIKESVELNENFRTLARHGMGTEPKSSRTKVGLELDYYDKDGSKRSGKIIKTDAKGYTVKDDRDGKTHSFSFHDRAKAKSLLAKHGKGKYNEEFDLMESHFKVGDKVTCIESGMKGEVIKLDEPQVGKYYTVRREDGKVMKYASDELKKVMSEAMDPVDKDALKKKFKKRKDKDIDNDGDVDSTDEYLHKRRSAISKAIAKEESETKLKEKDVDRDGDEDDIDKSLKQRQQKAIDLD